MRNFTGCQGMVRLSFLQCVKVFWILIWWYRLSIFEPVGYITYIGVYRLVFPRGAGLPNLRRP